MEDNSKSGLTLRFLFEWNVNLDPSQESRPFADFYLSTNHSTDMHRIQLETAAGKQKMRLDFSGPVLKEIAPVKLLQGCNLNIDMYVHTFNAYEEAISNPAGSVVIPLYELASSLSPTAQGEGSVQKPLVFYMVHDEAYKYSKGSVTLARPPGFGSPMFMMLRGKQITPQDVRQVSIKALIERAEKNQHICARYIEASEVLYENVEPTMETVANINSAIWVSRAGIFPPVFYTVDVVKPVITEAFYQNCLEIVLTRFKMTRQQLLALDITGKNRQDILKMGSFAGQFLCAYIAHVIYRTDYVIAYDAKANEFTKILTENFGDVSVDMGACDCEDSARITIRIYLGLMRLHKQQGLDPVLQHVIWFLKAYLPFLVLLGVSSAQINAAPKDIMNMGAHENAMLVPLKHFVDELSRFHPSALRWQQELLSQDPDMREIYERSASYPELVLEGTGILEPTMQKERSIKTRLMLESFMDEEAFYALRRSYYYDEKNTSFYKTVEKIFTPVPLLNGASFGSFLVMHRDRSISDRVALKKKITKSASFSEFIADNKDVYMVMEPELTAAEKLAAFEGLKDIHPPMPLDAPSKPPARRQALCDALIKDLIQTLRTLTKTGSGTSVMEQVYYLRSGKVTKKCIEQLKLFFSSLPTGMLRGFGLDSEWVTDEVGGYRLTLKLDQELVDFHWRQNESAFQKKLPGAGQNS